MFFEIFGELNYICTGLIAEENVDISRFWFSSCFILPIIFLLVSLTWSMERDCLTISNFSLKSASLIFVVLVSRLAIFVGDDASLESNSTGDPSF